MLHKRFAQSEGSEITLSDNEIKDIKVIKSLENRQILWKGTTEKAIKQKGGFIGLLMRAGLLLMNNVLIPLDENLLLPLGITHPTWDVVATSHLGLI